jgi:hypothetical protein
MNELLDVSLVYVDTSLLDALRNLLFCMAISFGVRAYYIIYAKPLVGGGQVGNIIPLLAGITFLVILVVKTSLALSLGLVGALSIVRFRVPIKEPLELTYIFLAIVVGLGTGADKSLITFVVVFVLLSLESVRARFSSGHKQTKKLIVIESVERLDIDRVISVAKSFGTASLTRYNRGDSMTTLSIAVDLSEDVSLTTVEAEITSCCGNVKISFLSNEPVW